MRRIKLFFTGAVCAILMAGCGTENDIFPRENGKNALQLSQDEDPPYILRTRTRKPNGEVLADVKVHLICPANSSLNDSLLTDIEGIGEFDIADSGDYELYFSKEGYLDKTKYLNIHSDTALYVTLENE